MPRKAVPPLILSCDACGVTFSRPAWNTSAAKYKPVADSKRRPSVMSGAFCSRACYHAPRLPADEVKANRLESAAQWRMANREHVQAYKRRAYRRRQTETVSTETREYIAIIRRDPCVYCGAPTDTIDHVQPIARGGGVQWENLAPACRPCNSGKKDRTLLGHMLARL